MRYTFSSSEAALVANGHTADVLTPWTIIIDTDEQTITISKRNLKSISLVNTKIFAYVTKKPYLCTTFMNDIHNKDYSVVR